MAKAITVLENALVSRNNWNSLDSLLNYVLARCDDVDKQELDELIQLANIQLKNNIPIKDYF